MAYSCENHSSVIEHQLTKEREREATRSSRHLQDYCDSYDEKELALQKPIYITIFLDDSDVFYSLRIRDNRLLQSPFHVMWHAVLVDVCVLCRDPRRMILCTLLSVELQLWYTCNVICATAHPQIKC